MTDAHETPQTPGTPPHDDQGSTGGPRPASSPNLFESLRDAIDDLTVRATPAVREVSARAAELTAVAAAKAAPLARKAGDATADASGKLAERSRTWAAELRLTIAGDEGAPSTTTATADAPAGAAPSTAPSSEAPSATAETNSSGGAAAKGDATSDAPEAPAS